MTDRQRGLDDPQSPVWDAEAYLLPSSRSKLLVHAAEDGTALCTAYERGFPRERDPRLKPKDAIPRGYCPVCSVCDAVLRGEYS